MILVPSSSNNLFLISPQKNKTYFIDLGIRLTIITSKTSALELLPYGAMTVVRMKPKRRQMSRRTKLFGFIASVVFTLYFISISLHYNRISSHDRDSELISVLNQRRKKIFHTDKNSKNNLQPNGFISTLRGKKILVEVTTVGQFQYSYLEHVLDKFRDLCETGAKVSLHITTSNCDPQPEDGDPDCPLYERSAEETLENNYSVEKIDQLNERFRCRDPDGSLDVSVHLVSPDWGKQVVDNHRRIFYDRIDDGYDVFVHSEEDETIRPTNILAFMDEMEKLRQLVGDEVRLHNIPFTVNMFLA